MLDKIEAETKRLITLDLPIKRQRMEIDVALDYYNKKQFFDKAEVLKYRRRLCKYLQM